MIKEDSITEFIFQVKPFGILNCVCLSACLCVFVFMSIDVCVYVSICVSELCVSVSVCMCSAVCLCIAVCLFLCLCMSVSMYLHVSACMSLNMCVSVHMCVSVCVYFCVCCVHAMISIDRRGRTIRDVLWTSAKDLNSWDMQNRAEWLKVVLVFNGVVILFSGLSLEQDTKLPVPNSACLPSVFEKLCLIIDHTEAWPC